MIDEFKLAAMIRDTAEDVIEEFEARKITPLEQPPPFAIAIVSALFKLAAKIDGKPAFVLTPRQFKRAIRLNAAREEKIDELTAEWWHSADGLRGQNIAPPVTPP